MKKRILTVLGLALMFAVCTTGDAFADTVVSNAVTKATHVFQSVRTIVFVIGGFGLVGLAVQAIFGKVKWAWFGALAVGLGVLAAAGALITYATGDTATEDYSDTFSTNFQAESHMPNS